MTADGAAEANAFCILLSFEGIEPERYLDQIMPIARHVPCGLKVSPDERAFLDKLIRWTSVAILEGGSSILFWSEQVIAPKEIPRYEELLSAMSDKMRDQSFHFQAIEGGGKEVTATCRQALGGLETIVFQAQKNPPESGPLLSSTLSKNRIGLGLREAALAIAAGKVPIVAAQDALPRKRNLELELLNLNVLERYSSTISDALSTKGHIAFVVRHESGQPDDFVFWPANRSRNHMKVTPLQPQELAESISAPEPA